MMNENPQADGFQTVLKYGGCALGIAGAATGLGLVGAIMACTLLFYEPPALGDGQ
jgi:hypothetical protein